MNRVEQRWDRRATGLEPITVQSSIEIGCPPQDVWDFLLTPESAVLTGTGVLKAFRVPGTPVGVVGEQQCVVLGIGGHLQVHMVEIVEIEPLHKIVTRWLTMPNGMLSISTLTGTESGTTYTDQVGFQVASGSNNKVRQEVRKALVESHARLKACVEAGTRFPSSVAQDSDRVTTDQLSRNGIDLADGFEQPRTEQVQTLAAHDGVRPARFQDSIDSPE